MQLICRGSIGSDVVVIQKLLQSQGFFDDTADGVFGDKTRSAVLYFQNTHNNQNNQPLIGDGLVGPETWWALHNPSGSAQRMFLKPKSPNIQSTDRAKIIAWIENEHRLGIKEEPDGSNWSPRIKQYLNVTNIAYPAPWCQAFVSCAFKESMPEFKYLMRPTARVSDATEQARDLAKYYTVQIISRFNIIPGDQFIVLNGDGTGHTGFIYRVSADEKYINTIEGNCGNRVALQKRETNKLTGIIKWTSDAEFERGLCDADSTSNKTR